MSDSNSVTVEAPPEEKADVKKRPSNTPPKRKHLPPWKVLLHNDDVNDMGYVVQTIIQLTPLKQMDAVGRMFEAHKTGVALLLTTHQELAELYRDQFRSKRLRVSIEPAEDE